MPPRAKTHNKRRTKYQQRGGDLRKTYTLPKNLLPREGEGAFKVSRTALKHKYTTNQWLSTWIIRALQYLKPNYMGEIIGHFIAYMITIRIYHIYMGPGKLSKWIPMNKIILWFVNKIWLTLDFGSQIFFFTVNQNNQNPPHKDYKIIKQANSTNKYE